MTETFDTLVRGGTLAFHDGIVTADVGIRDGRIARLGDLATASADQVIDAAGLHVLPGVIDTQVHVREPGNEHKEDLESGSRGAVLGGVTALFEMPNTNPLTTTAAALEDKLARARGRMWCDHAFYVGATADAGAAFKIAADEAEERALYVAFGEANIDNEIVEAGQMAVLTPGVDVDVSVSAGTRFMLAGGEPMDGPRKIDWNLVATDTARIEQAKADWRASAEGGWKDTPFTLPEGETEYIPLPED